MRDQTPLFLPTARNAALQPLRRPEAGSALLGQDAVKFSFNEADPTLRLPAPVVLPEKPHDAVMEDALPLPLRGFGYGDAQVAPLPARGGIIEVLSARTNQRVWLEVLPAAVRPSGGKAWRPMEFSAAVDTSGLVGALAVTERSDVEEAETFFRNYLARTFRLGERLPPGFYRVLVGP